MASTDMFARWTKSTFVWHLFYCIVCWYISVLGASTSLFSTTYLGCVPSFFVHGGD